MATEKYLRSWSGLELNENHVLVGKESDDISDSRTNPASFGAMALQLTQVRATLRRPEKDRMIAVSALAGISHRDKCKDWTEFN